MLTLKLAAPARPSLFSRLVARYRSFEETLYAKSDGTRMLLSGIVFNYSWPIYSMLELAEAGTSNLVLFAPHLLMFVLNAKLAQLAFRLN